MRRPSVRLPLPYDLPPSAENSFRNRYRQVKLLVLRWQAASAHHTFQLSGAIDYAWLNHLAHELFRGPHQFHSPADLLALEQAVRELATDNSLGVGSVMDAGEGRLTVHIFQKSIPRSRHIGTGVPHVDDALILLGERSRAKLPELVKRSLPLEQFLFSLNSSISSGLDPRELVSRCAYLAPGSAFEDPILVRPMPWKGATDEPLQLLTKPCRDFPRRTQGACHLLGTESLPSWRQQLIAFSREAVYELAQRGFGNDLLPKQFSPQDTFEMLAYMLIERANQAIRHTGAQTIEPIPQWGHTLSEQIAYKVCPNPSESKKGMDESGIPLPTVEGPTHGEGFAWVEFKSVKYEFTKPQRDVIRVLWEDWLKGGSGIPTTTMLTAAKTENPRPRDVFKSCVGAWGKLIVPGTRRGTYTLAFPPRSAPPKVA